VICKRKFPNCFIDVCFCSTAVQV